jgi:hypothetical protein
MAQDCRPETMVVPACDSNHRHSIYVRSWPVTTYCTAARLSSQSGHYGHGWTPPSRAATAGRLRQKGLAPAQAQRNYS